MFFFGGQPTNKSIIISNHVGSKAPLSLEIHAQFPIRLWGTHEMNSGFRKLYRYQTRIYYHQKKGVNLHLARLFCLVASPLTNMFYRGLRLISTYPDYRFRQTIKESDEALEKGDNIVIFPENSDDGYHDELTSFYTGFALLAEHQLKKGVDLPIYVAYLRRKDKIYVFDRPILYSDLKKLTNGNREAMGKYLLDKCNALGKMDLQEILDIEEANKKTSLSLLHKPRLA